MKNIYKIFSLLIFMNLILVSCHNELDQFPTDPDSFTQEDVFVNTDEAKSALAKLYASLTVTGQSGPAGDPDINGIDEGASQFTRVMFNLSELTTDNAVVGWGDPGLPDLHGMSWSSGNDFTEAMYYRLGQTVSFCNSFIQNAEALAADPEVGYYIAEARFIRAYIYYNLIDMFGNVPLVTVVSTELPVQSNRAELFTFVESELLEIQDQLKDSGSNEYGRVDKAAAWSLLSRLYLNAQTWIGENRYADCVTYSSKVINSSYVINTNDVNGNGSAYDELFLSDNNSNGAQKEFIFVVNFDALSSQTYGGTTFLVFASIGGSMVSDDYGVNGGWGGLRTTKALVSKFDSSVTSADGNGYPLTWADHRAMFYTNGQNYEIETIANTFTDGYAVTKFKNIPSTGNTGQRASFVSTDLPLIRLAEIYLNYAEATVRGGGGDINLATSLVNELRERAYGNSSADITSGMLTEQFILDERARELYWEGLRRTDLIRYGQFTSSSYLWPFKGNVSEGTGVDDFRNLFPLPSNIIAINPNLQQNTGY